MVAAACSSGDDESPPMSPADAGFATVADAGTPDSGVPDKPHVDGTAQMPWPTGDWLMTPSTGSQGALFIRGQLSFPSEGEGFWLPRELDEEGRFPEDLQPGTIYAAKRVTVDQPLKLIARLDAMDLAVDGYTYPSDPYRHGEARMAITIGSGEHELMAEGSNARGRPRIQLWTTDNDVWLNTNDVTRPDIFRDEAQDLYIGLPLLNLTGEQIEGLEAYVLDSEYFAATRRPVRPLPADGMTQIGFDLSVKAPIPESVDTATVTLAVTGPSLDVMYVAQYGLRVVERTEPYRRTFVSEIDESIQTYAVRPPTEFIGGAQYALALSLHGAGVRALGQARAYGPKDWAYVVAATNRRRFGFDWQDWGRLDALEVYDQALTHLPIDPLRTHVTGHSMGGHGTWHLGVFHPDLFAVIGPSAGWRSFASYGGEATWSGAFVQARAHNDTLNYRRNFRDRSVYIIHGRDDNNVPVSQARTMFSELNGIPRDLLYHEEPGAGHWWDGYPEPGAACVDWPPMFDLMAQRQRSAYDLSFDFVSPSPWVSARRSFIEVQSAVTPLDNFEIISRLEGNRVTVIANNVASMIIETEPLKSQGVTELVVNNGPIDLSSSEIIIGLSEKRPGLHGPIKEALFRPFCFVYPDDSAPRSVVRETVTQLMATWSIIGNGASCAVPFSARDSLGDANRVYVGVPSAQLPLSNEIPFTWSGEAIDIFQERLTNASIQMVFPEGDRLAVALYATAGAEWQLRLFQPFSSRTAFPDFATIVENDGQLFRGPSGFFDRDWRYDPQFAP